MELLPRRAEGGRAHVKACRARPRPPRPADRPAPPQAHSVRGQGRLWAGPEAPGRREEKEELQAAEDGRWWGRGGRQEAGGGGGGEKGRREEGGGLGQAVGHAVEGPEGQAGGRGEGQG